MAEWLDWLALTPSVMGALALGFFWIHTLLIAGAALMDLRALSTLRRRLRPLTLADGAVGLAKVRSRGIGRGPSGELACNRVRQVGRSKGDEHIHFSDACHESEIYGGEVDVLGDVAEIVGGESGQVWPDLQVRRRMAANEDADMVRAVIPEARRGRGWTRTVEVTLGERPDQSLWVFARLRRHGGRAEPVRWRLLPIEDAGVPLLLAADDPRAWIRSKQVLIVAFVVAELLVAGLCTVLVLWPPVFGWVSMLGAAASLGFFLGVQPLGVSLNEAVRTPDRAYLRGSWRG
ncbi:MAG: hypothetical protein KC457_21790 [Myxococcales bacterium]|nr:hypothetical protein [Myxococcales bacterium]